MGYAEALLRRTKWPTARKLMVDQNAMIHTNRYVRLVLAGCGLLLLGVGSAAAYLWFYKMVPTRHLADPEWLAAHSEAVRWAEAQNASHL
jgi:hypothetical protein